MNWMPGQTLESIEKAAILKALQFYRGNKTQTASALQIAIRTLDNKLEKYAEEEKALDDGHAAYIADRSKKLQEQRGTVQSSFTNGPDTAAGMRVESALKDFQKSKVPMLERPEVQEVLPGKAAKSRSRRASA